MPNTDSAVSDHVAIVGLGVAGAGLDGFGFAGGDATGAF